MALFWRIWAAVLIVNTAVLAVFVGLATLQFDQIHSALAGERLTVLADRTVAPFATAAQINLPLSAVRNAAALLERARQTDELITAIHVFDVEGRTIHSTEATPPATIPPVAIAAYNQADGAPWHRETDNGFLSGVDIAGPAGRSAGGIVVVYPSRENIINVRAMGAELAIAAMALLGATSILSGILLRLGLRRQLAAFESIDEAVADFERDSWRSAAARRRSPSAQENAGELRLLLDAADRKYRAVGREMAAREAER
ncbi:hypothetical protein [Inquilinus sp. CAU 1745]|uniref:hypothetical protein n=1 Tax=Inquilinus sp. CAU 1745 TaxID=3140369 RepID=UPI00325BE148